MKIHRKIYEEHYGPIGHDERGRSLEVHHIDGNHSNNSIDNLKLVTIEEHYAIHKAQGDWGACAIMSHRMRLTKEEVSELSRKCQKARIEAGTHNLLGPEANNRRIENGTHNFLDGEAARQRNLKRVAEGTHNFQGENNPVHQLIEKGEHHFQTNNPVQKLLATGAHASKIKVSCRFCKKTTSKNQFRKFHASCDMK